MTLEILLLHIAILAACWYMILEYPKLAIPPYQEPVKPDMPGQWKDGPKADTLEPTVLNPQAAWPFPRGPKP